MYFRALWLVAALTLVLLGGPTAWALGKVNSPDAADVYLLIDLDARKPAHPQIVEFGATEIGPVQPMFARMIHAPPKAKLRLVAAGYMMLPAGDFAEICGFEPGSSGPISSRV